MTPRSPTFTIPQYAIAILVAILLLIILTTYYRYGFNYDEYYGLSRANRWWSSFSSSGSAKASHIDIFHGSAPDAIALLVQKLVPSLSFHSRHLVCALFGLAGIFYTYQLGSRFSGQWIGFFAALLLTLTPMWFGHMFINHKDIPFATLLLASSYYCIVALIDRHAPVFLWVKIGLALGLLMATKAGGLLALPFIVAVFITCLRFVAPTEEKLEPPDYFVSRLLMTLSVGLLGMLVSSFVFWPQVYLGSSSEWSQFMRTTHHRGWTGLYAIMYFVITTPVYILFLGLLGSVLAAFRRNAPIIASVIVFATFFLGAALAGARIYNGCRHFLFVYPFFMLAAAYPLGFALDSLRGNLARSALIGGIALCAATTVYQVYRLFPYQYSFYNILVGGIGGANGTYDIDSWRTAHREALEKIEARLKAESVVRIYSCGPKIDFLMHPQIKRTREVDDADYIISLSHRRGRRCRGGRNLDDLPMVAEVQRNGVVLARIYAQPK